MTAWTEARSRHAAYVLFGGALVLAILELAYFLLGPTTPPWRQVQAHMAVSADTVAAKVHVRGTTDLPDGARIDYVFLPDGELENSVRAHQFAGGTVVEAGAFSFDADLAGWPQGIVLLSVSFAVGPETSQPPGVVARFGSEGELMAGPAVSSDSGGRNALVVNTKLQLGE